MIQNINPMPELENLLKQLRLIGILETLAQSNKEAIQGKLTYPEFLALVLQDEMLRREQKKFDTRARKAGFNANKTMESFDFLFNPKINKAEIIDLASCQFVNEKVCALIVGRCGTGKSHLAQAIAQRATQIGIDSLFISFTQIMSDLQSARATGVYEKRKKALVKLPLLFIDDFGLKPLKPQQEEDFHDLMAERYENAATVITSNLDFEEWIQAFPNQLLGVATLDRIRHGAYKVVLDGKSYRSFKIKKNNTKKTEKEGLNTTE
jgi:DNA replication protein DnaC